MTVENAILQDWQAGGLQSRGVAPIAFAIGAAKSRTRELINRQMNKQPRIFPQPSCAFGTPIAKSYRGYPVKSRDFADLQDWQDPGVLRKICPKSFKNDRFFPEFFNPIGLWR
jgi:hypothetical protein